MSKADMRRGADEANRESAQLANARALGEAVGGMADLVFCINRLTERIVVLELQVAKLLDREP